MNAETAKERTGRRLNKTVEDKATLQSAILRVYSDEHNLDWQLASGEINGVRAQPSHPYHAASVGKTFTATIVAMLAEEGELAFGDPIQDYLDEEVLDGLHVYKGQEYTDEITIRHLLNHTSGLPHFHPEDRALFNRKPEESPEGQTFFDVMLSDPDRVWEPRETTEWAKEHLEPHFPPGGGPYYSEVGYNLLGMIIERVTDSSYADALSDYVFDPLGMEHSYLPPFSEPAVEPDLPVADFYIDDEAYDVHQYRSFSAWWAGGQTVNTADELLRFHRGLAGNELVTAETLAEMRQWNKLSMGIDYGYGVLRLRPLPFLSKYYSWGGLGATSSFMFYTPSLDTYLAGTFNQWSYMGPCMRFLFRTLRTVNKIS